MLDIKFVRDNQEAVAEAMKNRHASWDASRFSELDEIWAPSWASSTSSGR